MNNFVFRNPTKLIFGKGTIARLADEIPAGCKLMVTFGGGSVKKNGVYEQVTAALKGRDYIEFWASSRTRRSRPCARPSSSAGAGGSTFCWRWAAAACWTARS